MLISTIHNGVIHHDIVHTEKISNRDTPYVIFNIKTKKYQPHYNFIYNKKNLDTNSYTTFILITSAYNKEVKNIDQSCH